VQNVYKVELHFEKPQTLGATEMKYMRRTAGYIWTDYKTNAQIVKELKITQIFGQITGIQEKLDTTCK